MAQWCGFSAVDATAPRVRDMSYSDPAKKAAHNRAYRLAHSYQRVCDLEGCDKLIDKPGVRVCQMHRARLKRTGTYERVVACLHCGVEFAPMPSPGACTSGFCSEQCRAERKRDRARRAQKGLTERICAVCGIPFVALGKRKYCGTDCFQAHERRRLQRYRPEPLARPIVKRTCAGCSIVFETVYPSKKYHVRGCAEHHSEPGKERRKAGRKMRALRLRLWARDAACYLCGQDIDYSLKYPNDMSPQPDHLTPLSMGGPTTLDNLAIVHMRCNLAKGDAPAAWWERDRLAALRVAGRGRGVPMSALSTQTPRADYPQPCDAP
jgi:5-methylcytosine-specific restriction endonuclease McrA